MKRPPGNEYREYGKGYRTRFYRFYRLFLNNFTMSLKNKWAIVVIVLAYMFVFINVMIFAMGGESLVYDPGRDNDTSTMYHVTRIPQENPVSYVSLGDILLLNYTITNNGDLNGSVEIETTGPSPMWFSEAMVFPPKGQLDPGETAYIIMGVLIPDNYENYTWIPEDDYLSDNEIDPEMEETAERFGIDIGAFMSNKYLFNDYDHTRSVNMNIYVVNNVSAGDDDGIKFNEERLLVSSMNEMIVLRDNATTPHIDGAAGSPGFSIDVIDRSTRSMKAGEEEKYALRLTNDDVKSARIGIDVISSSDNNDRWSYEVIDADGVEDGVRYIDLEAGEVRDIDIRLAPGFMASYRDHDLIITGTDLSNNGNLTNLTILRVQVKGYVTDDRGKETMYEYFWTGENYDKYLWLIFLSAVAGAGLIANDYKSNSISLYLSRPVTRRDYVLGKAAALTGILSMVSFLPAIIIFTAAMALTSVSLTYIIEHMWILGSLLLSYIFTLMVFVPFCLAVSSSTKKGIIAGAGIFSTLIFTSTISDILYAIFDVKYLKLINIFGNFSSVFKLLFDLEYNSSSYGYEWYYPAAVLIFIGLASCGVIYYRITREVK